MWLSILDESTNDTLLGGSAVGTDEFYVGGRIKNSSACLSHCAVIFHKTLSDSGNLYHSIGDNNWNLVAVPTINNLEDVWGSSGELFVVGANATILHKY